MSGRGKAEAHYALLRRRAAARSRARRKKTGEPAPGLDWFCSRCHVSVKRGEKCPSCGTGGGVA